MEILQKFWQKDHLKKLALAASAVLLYVPLLMSTKTFAQMLSINPNESTVNTLATSNIKPFTLNVLGQQIIYSPQLRAVTESTTISVDTSLKLGAIEPKAFGNHVTMLTYGNTDDGWTYKDNLYLFDTQMQKNNTDFGGGIWDPNTKTSIPKMISLATDKGVASIRFTGGDHVHFYNWHKTVGSIYDSKGKQIRQKFGLNEMLQYAKDIGAKPTIEIAEYKSTGVSPQKMNKTELNEYMKGDPNDAANLVAYLNDPNDAQHPWGQKRAKDGYPNPWNVKFFEYGCETYYRNPDIDKTGNDRGEPDFGEDRYDDKGNWLAPRTMTDDEYSRNYYRYSAAMKKVDPNIQLGAVVTGKKIDAYRTWDNTLLKNDLNKSKNEKVDFLILHDYIPSIPAGADSNDQSNTNPSKIFSYALASGSELQNELNDLKEKSKNLAGRAIPVAMTEYNSLYLNKSANGSTTNLFLLKTLGQALVTADLFNTIIKPQNNVNMADFHNFFQDSLGQVYMKKDAAGRYNGEYIKHPVYYTFLLYYQHFGKNLLKTSVEGPGYTAESRWLNRSISDTTKYPVNYLTANSSTNSDGSKVYVMVINKDQTNERKAKINLSSFNAGSVKAWTLNGPAIDSTNDSNQNNVSIKESSVEVSGGSLNYTFEPHSLTALEITKPVPKPVVDHIEITPSSSKKIISGETIQFSAKAYDVKNVEITGLKFTWSETNATGLFNNTKPGTYSIKASSEGKTSNSVQTIVQPKAEQNLDHITINPKDNPTATSKIITAGGTVQFVGHAYDSANKELQGINYTWSNTNNIGLFSNTKAGTYVVTAASGGKTSPGFTVKVNPAAFDRIAIGTTPNTTRTLLAGHSIPFYAQAQDKFLNSVGNLTYSWSGTSSKGVFTNTKAGTYGVKASVGSKSSATININVNPNTLDHIAISPTTTQTITSGQTIQFSAQGQDKYNNNISGLKYTWNGTNAAGLFTNTAVGNFSVKSSSGGKTSAAVGVVVKPSALHHITITPSTTQSLMSGRTLQFVAKGFDSNNIVIPNLIFSWTGTSSASSGLFNNAKVGGPYKVQASSGGKLSPSISVTVTPSILHHIAIGTTPNTVRTLTAGQTIPFYAQGQDIKNVAIAGLTYTWSGTSASSSGLFNNTKAGIYPVKATSGGKTSATININVNPNTLDHIAISPTTTQTITSGQTIQFSAQGQDKYNNNISGLKYTWNGTNAAGLFADTKAGTYSVKSTSSGKSSASVSVVVKDKDSPGVTAAPTPIVKNTPMPTSEVIVTQPDTPVTNNGIAVTFKNSLPANTTEVKVTEKQIVNKYKPAKGKKVVGVYEITAVNQDGSPITSDIAVTVTISYPSANDSIESKYSINFWDGKEWSKEGISNVKVDTNANSISFDTTHFTDFAITIENTGSTKVFIIPILVVAIVGFFVAVIIFVRRKRSLNQLPAPGDFFDQMKVANFENNPTPAQNEPVNSFQPIVFSPSTKPEDTQDETDS